MGVRILSSQSSQLRKFYAERDILHAFDVTIFLIVCNYKS